MYKQGCKLMVGVLFLFLTLVSFLKSKNTNKLCDKFFEINLKPKRDMPWIKVSTVSNLLSTSAIFIVPPTFNILLASRINSFRFVPIRDRQNTTTSTCSFFSGTFDMSHTVIWGAFDIKSKE